MFWYDLFLKNLDCSSDLFIIAFDKSFVIKGIWLPLKTSVSKKIVVIIKWICSKFFHQTLPENFILKIFIISIIDYVGLEFKKLRFHYRNCHQMKLRLSCLNYTAFMKTSWYIC